MNSRGLNIVSKQCIIVSVFLNIISMVQSIPIPILQETPVEIQTSRQKFEFSSAMLLRMKIVPYCKKMRANPCLFFLFGKLKQVSGIQEYSGISCEKNQHLQREFLQVDGQNNNFTHNFKELHRVFIAQATVQDLLMEICAFISKNIYNKGRFNNLIETYEDYLFFK